DIVPCEKLELCHLSLEERIRRAKGSAALASRPQQSERLIHHEIGGDQGLDVCRAPEDRGPVIRVERDEESEPRACSTKIIARRVRRRGSCRGRAPRSPRRPIPPPSPRSPQGPRPGSV